MRIAVFGTGYVGLVTGVCFADLGNTVYAYDIDESRIRSLKRGISPIYEPGTEELLARNLEKERIIFTTSARQAVENGDVIFIAVGTPSREDGAAELKYIKQAARTIGRYLNGYKVIVNKSTVPVGMADIVKDIVSRTPGGKKFEFDVVSNPEFLREGSAVYDFMNPDRIVLGSSTNRAFDVMRRLYRPVKTTIVETTPQSAELIKYASNAMLATRISFVNELANLCEKVGADIEEVAAGMGLDGRIGPSFLKAGIGYGGSCFPKDTRALVSLARQHRVKLGVVENVIKANERQRQIFLRKLLKILKKHSVSKMGVLGLSFKPDTDDLREAPSIDVIAGLRRAGLSIRAYDPVAIPGFKKLLPKGVTYTKDAYSAAKGVEALLILTEWNEFMELDLDRVKESMKKNLLVDGRNIYPLSQMKERGFKYISVGRPEI